MQNQLFVGNLAFSTTKEELAAAFSKFGTILEVKIPVDRDTGRVRGFAFVTFETQQAAESALALDNTELNGRAIRVNVAQEKKADGGGRSSSGRQGGSRGGASGGRHHGSSNRHGGGRDKGANGHQEGGWW